MPSPNQTSATIVHQPQQQQATDTNNNSNKQQQLAAALTNGHSADAQQQQQQAAAPSVQVGQSSRSSDSSNAIFQPAAAATIRGDQMQPQQESPEVTNNSFPPSKPSIRQQQQQQRPQNNERANHFASSQSTRHAQQATQKHHYSNQAQQHRQAHSSRGLDELLTLIKDLNFDRTSLSNEELIRLVKNQKISIYKLESFLGKDNALRCVEVRRDYYRLELAELDRVDLLGINDRSFAFLFPKYEDLEYEKVNGACCENVIGHVKVPVGLAGPLVLDGEEIFVPLATTEGCLVASTCRGLSALRKSGGVSSRVRKDFMTRAPIVRFIDLNLRDALNNVERAIAWLNDLKNREKMRQAFNLTSSHGKFLNYTTYPVSREIHIRFEAQTGDAMGMNMCSKGVESALKEMQKAFPTMEIVTLSGNMCTDKKAAGINWINGRGKSVECNAELPAHVVQQVFKVSVDSMIDRWKSKVMVGSALAASIGGFNSQAANILTAIFIATGQDPAQNVTSSNCMLILEKDSKGSLVVCCTMPSIECGTVGGGTILADQSRYLQMMGVKGPTPKFDPGQIAMSVMQRQQQQITIGLKQTTQQKAPNTNGGLSKPAQNDSYISNGDNSNLKEQQHMKSNDLYTNTISTNFNNNNNIIDTSALDKFSENPILSIASPINGTNGYTNARKLARIICATVMAGELSLLAALTEGTLVKSHMRHNRSSTNVTASTLSSSCLNASTGVTGFGSLNGQNVMFLNNNINSKFVHNNNNHYSMAMGSDPSVDSGSTGSCAAIGAGGPIGGADIGGGGGGGGNCFC